MTIDTLPASPAGEIDHIDVRLKINEIVDFVNQPYINVTITQNRATVSYTHLTLPTTPYV